jgi:putative phosphoesterase
VGETIHDLGGVTIGIISDTHGTLHPKIAEVFANVDHIIHAGDIGGDDVLDALRRIAPVTFVRGNNDAAEGIDVVRVTLGGVRFLVTHILPRPSKQGNHVVRSLAREPTDVVVFGHSHLPHDEVVDGVRFFNPASAGPRRFDFPTSVGLFDGARMKHVALDERSIAALKKRMNQMR